MRYLYNKSDIYTLLYKQGNVEVKPGKYIEVSEVDVANGVYGPIQGSSVVDLFEKLEDVPVPKSEVVTPAVVEPIDPMAGLTEAQLKVHLETKAVKDAKQPKGARGTPIGRPVEPEVEKTETEKTE